MKFVSVNFIARSKFLRRNLFDPKLLKQLDDFLISIAIKTVVIFKLTHQSALCETHGVCRVGTSSYQNPDDPFVSVDDSTIQCCPPVILLAQLDIRTMVQQPFQHLRSIQVDACVQVGRNCIDGFKLVRILGQDLLCPFKILCVNRIENRWFCRRGRIFFD